VVEETTRLTGITAAGRFANITAPVTRGPSDLRGSMVILDLAKGGTTVQAGDLVAQFDPQFLRDRTDDQRDTVSQNVNDLKRRQAEQAVQMEDLLQTLRVSKANLEKAQLDYQAAEVRTEVERELLKLAVDEAQARYRQQEKDLAFRRESQRAELKTLELTGEMQKRRLDRLNFNLERYTIRAPMPGLVVLQTTFRGGESTPVAIGDQVGSGQLLMKIVDPSSMLVEATVNQAEASVLRVGQEARVGFDAFAGLELKGKVSSLGALAVSGFLQSPYIRNIPVRIKLEQLDPRVIPDLSAYADVVLKRSEPGPRVPVAAIEEKNGQSFVLVKSGESWERRPVTVGVRSNVYARIESGLKTGEVVKLP
jgi:multidrug efflux pump subunit AcrA (membrane-fusion protein)